MPNPRIPRRTGTKPKRRETLISKISSPDTPEFWEKGASKLAEKGLTEAAAASRAIAEKLRSQGENRGVKFNALKIRRKPKS
ncbi:MAG: hypothetical protein AABW72_03650 [archaeon]